MQLLLEVGLSNAVAAAVLAVAVVLVTRFWRNPHAAHVLWLLVLAKLVTPPLWQLRVPRPETTERSQPVAETSGDERRPAAPPSEKLLEEVVEAQPIERQPRQTLDAGRIEVAELPVVAPPLAVEELPEEPRPKQIAVVSRAQPANVPAAAVVIPVGKFEAWSLSRVLLALWLGGAGLVACIALLRVLRFQRLLRATDPAPEAIVEQVAQLAARLALRRRPHVRLISAAVGPFVWPHWRRPVVLLPCGLVEDLSGEQLATVLAHELAHVKRRDHLVRLLEVVVTALYWWHPLLPFVRRRLRAAEETCCDAWVLQLFPNRRRQYGEALLRAGEFGSSHAAPLLASGIGRDKPNSLKRRIEMILSNRVPTGIGRWARFVLLAAAVAVLPLSAAAVPQERSDSLPAKQPSQLPPARETQNHLPNSLLGAVADDNRATTTRRRGDTEQRLSAIEQKLNELAKKLDDLQQSLDPRRTSRSSLDSRRIQDLQRMGLVQGRNAAARNDAQIKVFALEFADAEELAGLLQELLADGSTRIVAEQRTNSLVVRGEADDLEAIEALISRLDAAPRRAPNRVGAPNLGLGGLFRAVLPEDHPIETGPAPVEGTVLAVGEDSTVEISLGIDDGLKSSPTWYIYREGPNGRTYVGEIRLLTATKDRATARVMKLQTPNVQQGDRVTNQPPRQPTR